MKNTASKTAKLADSKFDSRTCYTESRSMSGFRHSKKYVGHEVGQIRKNCRNQLLKEMAKDRAPIPYRLAKVYNGPKEQFVEYYYYCTIRQRYIRDKIRLGLRKLTRSEKLSQLQELCTELNKLLRERNRKLEYHVVYDEPELNKIVTLTLLDSLEYVRGSGDEDISEDRKRSISETMTALNEFYKAHSALSGIRVDQISEEIIKIFRKWCKSEKKTGKTINKYLSIIHFCTNWLYRKKMIPQAIDTKELRVAAPKNESGRFPPLTDAEKQRAFSYWRRKDPHFHHFLFWAYYSCVRGNEIYRLQRKDINFESRTVFLSWIKTKNATSNYVQILQPLYDLMIELGIDKLAPNTYLFGRGFAPSKDRYTGQQSTMRWAAHREGMKMPAEKQLYGLKHTFNVDYVEQNKRNIDWEWLRRHNRHATVQQTQQYISGLTAYFLDETQAVIKNYYI